MELPTRGADTPRMNNTATTTTTDRLTAALSRVEPTATLIAFTRTRDSRGEVTDTCAIAYALNSDSATTTRYALMDDRTGAWSGQLVADACAARTHNRVSHMLDRIARP